MPFGNQYWNIIPKAIQFIYLYLICIFTEVWDAPVKTGIPSMFQQYSDPHFFTLWKFDMFWMTSLQDGNLWLYRAEN